MEKTSQEAKDIYVNSVIKHIQVNPKERKYSEDKIKESMKLYMEGNSG